MITCTAALALFPLVFGGNKPGHEIEHPMAIVIIGGVITSTVLNLFLLPPLYRAFGRGGDWEQDFLKEDLELHREPL